MNTLMLGFIGPQEIIIILFFLLLPAVVAVVLIVVVIRYVKKKNALKNEIPQRTENPVDEEIINRAVKNNKTHFPVKEGNKITLIPFDEIVDLSVQNSFVFLTDLEGKEYVVDSSLNELNEKFPGDFIRIHKSTVVNKNLIHEVKKLENGRFDLVMKCKKERILSCSKNYNDKIKTLINF